MDKNKKTLSYYTEKKITFALYCSCTAGLVYMFIMCVLNLTDVQPYKTISFCVLGVLLLFVVGVLMLNAAFGKDKADELARYDMSVVHEKMSDFLLYYVIICIALFFIISGGFTINMNSGELLILIILQPVLYLTVEQGMFLFVHGKESKDDSQEENEGVS